FAAATARTADCTLRTRRSPQRPHVWSTQLKLQCRLFVNPVAPTRQTHVPQARERGSMLMPELAQSDRQRLTATLRRAVDALKSLQKSDGHWCAELEGDSILE